MVKRFFRSYGKVVSEQASIRDTENWNVLSQFDTIRSVIRIKKPPEKHTELQIWTRTELKKIHKDVGNPKQFYTQNTNRRITPARVYVVILLTCRKKGGKLVPK